LGQYFAEGPIGTWRIICPLTRGITLSEFFFCRSTQLISKGLCGDVARFLEGWVLIVGGIFRGLIGICTSISCSCYFVSETWINFFYIGLLKSVRLSSYIFNARFWCSWVLSENRKLTVLAGAIILGMRWTRIRVKIGFCITYCHFQ